MHRLSIGLQVVYGGEEVFQSQCRAHVLEELDDELRSVVARQIVWRIIGVDEMDQNSIESSVAVVNRRGKPRVSLEKR